MVGIYKITNLITNKVYIGQSIDINRRWVEHKCYYKCNNHHNSNSYLYKSMKKYGLDNFKFEIVEVVTEDQLDEKEIFYIKLFKSDNRDMGYNLTEGGDKGPTLSGLYNPNSKLTYDIIYKIRELYLQGNLKSQAYKIINDVTPINFNTFGGIWNGGRYKDIHYDVYNKEYKENIQEQRKINRSMKTHTESRKYVLEIRDARQLGLYWKDVFEKYKDIISKSTFMDIWSNHTYKFIQSKITKQSSLKHINKRKYSNTKIEQRDVSTNKVIKVFDNLYAISSSLRGKYDKNFCARIIRVCNKKEKTACGYIWTFEDSND